MFKKLKQKIVEEVENSPLRPSPNNASTTSLNSIGRLGSSQLDVSDANLDQLIDVSTDNMANNNAAAIDGSNLDNFDASFRSSSAMEGSFLGGSGVGEDQQASFSTPYSTPMSTPISVGAAVSRSRRSSNSSILSDVSATPAILQPSPSSPAKFGAAAASSSSSNGAGTFGVATASDTEAGLCPNLENLSREQLVFYFRRTEQNMLRYKAKLKEVSLSSHQEKFVRHMGEIKEQLILEQKAKKHLEENFTMTLDEKEEQIKVLQTQIKLLKETAPTMPEAGHDDAASAKEEETTALAKDNRELKERINQLENLLMKCKENIKTNKEKVGELTKDNEVLSKVNESLKASLGEKSELIESLLGESEDRVARLRREDDENMAKLARELEEAKRECEARVDEIAKLREEERRREEEEEGLEALRREIVELRKVGGEARRKEAELMEKMEKMSGDKREEEEANAALKKENGVLTKLKEEKEKENLMARNELDELTRLKEKVESTNRSLNEKMEKMTKEKEEVNASDLEEKLEEMGKKKRELEEAGKSSREQLGEVWTSLNEIKRERDQLQSRLEEAVEMKEEAEKKWSRSLDENEAVWKMKFSAREEENATLGENLEEKNRETSAMRRELDESKSSYESVLVEKEKVSLESARREEAWNDETSTLKEKIDELRAALSRKSGEEGDEIVELRAVVSRLEGRLIEDVAAKDLVVKNRESAVEILSSDLATASEKVALMEAELGDRGRKEKENEAKFDELNEKLKKERDETAKGKASVEEMKTRVDDLAKERTNLSRELESSREIVVRFQREMASKEEMLAEAIRRKEESDERRNEEKAAKEELGEKLVSRENDLAALKIEFDERGSVLGGLEDDLRVARRIENEVEADKESIEKRLRDADEEVGRVGLELRRAREETERLVKELEEKEEASQSMSRRFEDESEKLTGELRQKSDAVETLRHQMCILEGRRAETEERCGSLEGDLNRAKDEKKESEARNNEVMKTLKREKEEVVAKLTKELNESKTRLEAVLVEGEKSRSLGAECEALKAQLAKDGKGNEELAQLVQAKHIQIERLLGQSSDLSAKVQKYEADIEKAKKAFETLKTQAKAKIAEGQEKLKAKDGQMAREKQEFDEKLLEKSQLVDESNANIDGWKRRVAEKETEVSSKREEFEEKLIEKSQLVDELNESIDVLKRRAVEMEASAASKRREFDEMLLEKSQLVDELNETIDGMKLRVAEMEASELSIREEFDEKLLEKSQFIDELNGHIVLLNEKVEQMTAAALSKQEEFQTGVQKLTSEFEKTLLKFTTEHEGVIQRCKAEKDSLTQDLQMVREEKEKVVADLDATAKRLEEAQSLLRRKEEEDANKGSKDETERGLRRDLDALIETVATKEKELVRLTTLTDSLKEELDSSRSELTTQLEQDEELQGRLRELTEKLTSTESKLQDLTDTYENKLGEYQEALKEARKEKVSAYEDQIAKLERLKSEEARTLSSELRVAEEKASASAEALADASWKLHDCHKELKERVEKEEASRRNADELNARVEDLCARMVQMDEESYRKSSEIESLRNQIRDWESKMKESEEIALKSEPEAVVAPTSRVDELNNDLKLVEDERNSLEEELTRTKTDAAATKERLVDSEKERDAHLNRMDAERRDWETSRNQAQISINAHLGTIATLSAENQRLESLVDAETRSAAALKGDVENLAVAKSALEAQLRSAEEEFGDRVRGVKEEAEEKKNESISETLVQFAVLRESVGELEAEIDKLKVENEELRSGSGDVDGSVGRGAEEDDDDDAKEFVDASDRGTEVEATIEAEKMVVKCDDDKLLSRATEVEHTGDDSVGAEAGSHLDATEEEGERDNYVTTGNDVIIRELNNVVEKLEKEKAGLRASLDNALLAKSTFEAALEDIGCQRESDAVDWRREVDELEERIVELDKEKNRLRNDNALLRSVSKGSSNARVLEESDRRIEELEQDFVEKLTKMEGQNHLKTNHLFKEFNTKMAEVESKHQRAELEARKEVEIKEQKMIAEHYEEMEELQKEVFNFDDNLEEVKEDYENRLREMRIDQERTQKSMESLNKAFDKEVEKRVVVEVGVRQSERENALREELVTLADKWDHGNGGFKGDVLCPESLAALDRMQVEIENDDDEAKEADVDAMRRLELTREIEELRERQKNEVDELLREISASKSLSNPLSHHHHRPRCTSEDSPSEADKERRRCRPPTSTAVADADSSAPAAFPVLLQRLGDGLGRDQQLRYLKGTVIHQLNQLLRLRGVEAELRQRVDAMAHEESVTRMSPLFREPTEMEYLKKVLFEYMTGKEVATMTKVIAAIMKFTPEETKAVVDRAEGMVGKLLW